MIQILELFGGIGAPRCALRNIGIPVKSIDYVEIDEKAVRSYNAMFADELEYRAQDVRGWTLKPDVLVHGSPCQDFSIAGHQKGANPDSGTRSSLMWETLRIIRAMGEWRPRLVIWENVPNVLSKHMRHNFEKYLEAMRHMGYRNACDTLNATDFGLPQNRRRVFTVSTLGGKPFDFSTLTHRRMTPIMDLLEPNVSARQYQVRQPSMLDKIGAPRGRFRGYVPVITDMAQTITTAQMRCPNSGVIDTGHGYRYLTERECWRLQGFADTDYDAALAVNPTRPGCMNGVLYRQAGNAMPVPILEEILTKTLN